MGWDGMGWILIDGGGSVQNPEEAVTFDTVPNKKKQHEVNVGKRGFLSVQIGCILCIIIVVVVVVAIVNLWVYVNIAFFGCGIRMIRHCVCSLMEGNTDFDFFGAVFRAAISNSFGFGGHNSCVVFAPFKP